MNAMSRRLIPLAVATGMVAAATLSPAHALPVTFAQYVQQNGSLQQWAIATSGNTTTITASGAVFFSFSGVAGLPFSGPESAMFTLSATSTQLGNCGLACGTGDSFAQAGYTGAFSFIDTGLAPGSNLLSGTFAVNGSPSTSGPQLKSVVGSSGAAYSASTTSINPNQLIMTSSYLSLINQTQQNASWSLSSLIPDFATGVVVAGQARPANGTFNASGTGTFSSDPGPFALVPEPASMLVLGAGLVALGTLRRRPAAVARA